MIKQISLDIILHFEYLNYIKEISIWRIHDSHTNQHLYGIRKTIHMSHTFTNLKTIVGSNLTKLSISYAKNIPLIHCIRCVDLLYLNSIWECGFNLKGCSTLSKSKTKLSNRLLQIPEDSVYFYAGRALDDDDARIYLLIYENNCGCELVGNSSPFDSGGLVHSKLSIVNRNMTEVEKKAYYDIHSVKIESFREYLSLFLNEYFNQALEYWTSIPKRYIDDQVIGFTKDDWQNWTFEVVVHHSTKISNPTRLVLDESTSDYFLTLWKDSMSVKFAYMLTNAIRKPSSEISFYVDNLSHELSSRGI